MNLRQFWVKFGPLLLFILLLGMSLMCRKKSSVICWSWTDVRWTKLHWNVTEQNCVRMNCVMFDCTVNIPKMAERENAKIHKGMVDVPKTLTGRGPTVNIDRCVKTRMNKTMQKLVPNGYAFTCSSQNCWISLSLDQVMWSWMVYCCMDSRPIALVYNLSVLI